MKRVTKLSHKTIRKKVKRNIASQSGGRPVKAKADIKKLVHLLQVSQVELEHQNQELRIAEQELEASRNKYVNLFDFSPVPYVTLDPGGIMKEVNLSAGRMFGLDRSKLIGRNIHTSIPSEEKRVFDAFLKAVFELSEKQSCNVRILNKDKRVFHVMLEGAKADDSPELDRTCQIALLDMTEYKRLEDALRELSEGRK